MSNDRTARFAVPALVAALLVAAPGLAAGPQLFGQFHDLPTVTRVADILADPDAWVGKTVRIEGGVLDVCPKAGCWMEVGDDGRSLRVKVDDGVIVFPSDAKGRLVAAEGVVEAVDMERDQYVAWLAHLAEERGESFDEAAADIGEGPYRMIQIRGTGARISES